MILDRGESFGAYYEVPDPADPRRLFGIVWENAFPCGTYTRGGKTYGLTFIILLKELSQADDHPGHGESFDTCPLTMDRLTPDICFNPMLKGGKPPKVRLKPKIKQLVEYDESLGLTGYELIEKRAAVMVPEFMGFTLADVIADTPEVWQPTIDEEGNEVPNVTKCSEEKVT